jgi:transposase
MAGAISVDLRWRVVDEYERGDDSFEDVGLRFKVGEASVNRWVQLFRKTGSVDPKPHGGGIEPHIPDSRRDEFKEIIRENPDAYLPELAEICAKRFRASVSPAAVARTCKRANITRKKRH